MPQQPDVRVRRYVVYEEFTIPGSLLVGESGASPSRSTGALAGKVGAAAGRAALAAAVTLAPVCIAGLARVAARRALIGPRRETPALPYRG